MYGIYSFSGFRGQHTQACGCSHSTGPFHEVLGDERMAGHQHFTFEMLINEDGEREFGASNGAVSFQIAQLRSGMHDVLVS